MFQAHKLWLSYFWTTDSPWKSPPTATDPTTKSSLASPVPLPRRCVCATPAERLSKRRVQSNCWRFAFNVIIFGDMNSKSNINHGWFAVAICLLQFWVQRLMTHKDTSFNHPWNPLILTRFGYVWFKMMANLLLFGRTHIPYRSKTGLSWSITWNHAYSLANIDLLQKHQPCGIADGMDVDVSICSWFVVCFNNPNSCYLFVLVLWCVVFIIRFPHLRLRHASKFNNWSLPKGNIIAKSLLALMLPSQEQTLGT